MSPEGRFTTPTTKNAGVSDDFNDRIITNATCVREALIEVGLISASYNISIASPKENRRYSSFTARL